MAELGPGGFCFGSKRAQRQRRRRLTAPRPDLGPQCAGNNGTASIARRRARLPRRHERSSLSIRGTTARRADRAPRRGVTQWDLTSDRGATCPSCARGAVGEVVAAGVPGATYATHEPTDLASNRWNTSASPTEGSYIPACVGGGRIRRCSSYRRAIRVAQVPHRRRFLGVSRHHIVNATLQRRRDAGLTPNKISASTRAAPEMTLPQLDNTIARSRRYDANLSPGGNFSPSASVSLLPRMLRRAQPQVSIPTANEISATPGIRRMAL